MRSIIEFRGGRDLLPVFRTSPNMISDRRKGEEEYQRASIREAEMIVVLRQLEAKRNAEETVAGRSAHSCFAFSSLEKCRRFCSCKSTRDQQRSTRLNAGPQTLQYQSIKNNRIPQISICYGIWFGTRCSTRKIHRQGRVHEIVGRDERLSEITRAARQAGDLAV